MARDALILIVEDDGDLRELEAQLLEEAGYARIVTASEGREALERVACEMPTMIFLDMRMPGMDGWAFAREFRARYDRLALIVVVTAAANAGKSAAAIDADDFIAKPFSVEEFVAKAAIHLRKAGGQGGSPDP